MRRSFVAFALVAACSDEPEKVAVYPAPVPIAHGSIDWSRVGPQCDGLNGGKDAPLCSEMPEAVNAGLLYCHWIEGNPFRCMPRFVCDSVVRCDEGYVCGQHDLQAIDCHPRP